MRLYVGVTDNDWFKFHAEHKPDEVNFWRPGGSSDFGVIEQGAPFLFKLHSPLNYIAGGGFFWSYSRMSVSMAWQFFGEKNGTPDRDSFRKRILSYRREVDRPENDPGIGCIVLAVPFFFPRDLWMEMPGDWHPNIVQGKSYEIKSEIGKSLYDGMLERLGDLPGYLQVQDEVRKKGPLYVVEGRVGQGGFRTSVMEAYHRKCAVSQEKTIPALQASHIKPYKKAGPNRPSNGILLRADLHEIFDAGYLTITSDHKIEVSPRLKQDFENGREYYRFHGLPLPNLPELPKDRPDPTFIEWHNRNVFRR
jgi:putative restriction endonuclease